MLQTGTVRHPTMMSTPYAGFGILSPGVGPFHQTMNSNFVQVRPAILEFPLSQIPEDVDLFDYIVNFMPVNKKGPNYLKYCTNISPISKQKVIDCVRKYTSEKNWFCSKVNVALASDSPDLKSLSKYIKELKYSIEHSSMNYTGTVFRGLNMSPTEITGLQQMKGPFFIPSFISTSKLKSNEFSRKNALIHFDTSPKWSDVCMEIKPHHTDYPQEQEILFTSYNIFQRQRIEKSNGKYYIKLNIMDRNKYYDKHRNIIRNEHYHHHHHQHHDHVYHMSPYAPLRFLHRRFNQ